MSKETGGPAFPTPATDWNMFHEGMTLRDLFAALAMHGEISSGNSSIDTNRIALRSYSIADAMLKARDE